jgi:protein-L-isoaspartate(D-aspartate) O-methyltransferase
MANERLQVMVKQQLKQRGIVDERALSAMSKVERHLFVKKSDIDVAYDDRPLVIGHGQTISQPLMVAIMTEVLALEGNEKILEIGTGSGYQTALLAELGKEVYTIERIASLQDDAKYVLKKLNYSNIWFKVGDGTIGWAEEAPFDRIIVTAAAPEIPQSLFNQLAIGGMMAVPVGVRYMQELKLVLKMENGEMKVENRSRCIFVPLIGEEGWSQ